MEDLVSIIVPVYNVEKYLEKCMKSILNQTYSNLDIIVVDDGSSDNCPRLCEKIKLLDNRIKVFHKANGGVADARNFGLSKAIGQWVCFIDSDDYLKPTYIETMIRLAYKYKTDIVCCGYQFANEEGTAIVGECELQKEKCLSREDALFELICDRIRSYPWNKLFKRKLWNGELWSTAYKVYEDNATVYKIFAKAKKIVISDSKEYFYVQRSNSALHSMDLSSYIKFIEVLGEQESYIKKNEPKLAQTIPFEALRTEYIRRYVNQCINMNVPICMPAEIDNRISKLNKIKEILFCDGVLEINSIFSNFLFILDKNLYCKWRKFKNYYEHKNR